MATSWEKKRLGDLAMIIMGQSPKSEYYNNRGDGLPFFQGNRDFGELHPSPSTYCSLPSKIALPKDILMSVRAPVGALNLAAEECCIGRGLCAIRPNRSGRFIFYLLKANIENIHAAESGAVFGAVNKADLNSLLLLIPSDEQTQDKIAAILSAYDDLIENNLRRIKILEEMAQSIYREWFVKFRFLGHQKIKMVDSALGKIPEGWEVSTVNDHIAVVPRKNKVKTNSYLPEGIIPVIDQGKDLIAGFVDDTSLAYDGPLPIIVFGDHTCVLKWVDFRFAVGADWTQLIQPNYPEELPPRFLFYTLQFVPLEQFGYQRHFKYLKEAKILLPPSNLAQKFEETVNPKTNLILNLQQQNLNLRRTRDLLLPKLISGELDVSELDIKIAETERNWYEPTGISSKRR